jgi:hypothetical protein
MEAETIEWWMSEKKRRLLNEQKQSLGLLSGRMPAGTVCVYRGLVQQ